MAEVLLGLIWVAAHHGLRKLGASQRRRNMEEIERHVKCWHDVHRITTALGNPPAPGGPR